MTTTADSRGRTHTPAVRAHAERLGVDLGTVDGTGVAGRVRLEDVLAASRATGGGPPAGAREPRIYAQEAIERANYKALFGEDPPEPPLPRIVATSGREPILMRSRFEGGRQVVVDVYGPNPLLQDAQQSLGPIYALAEQEAPAPTLFASGDLPKFTASGLDPKLLNEIPWSARHAAAFEPDRGKVLEIVENAAQAGDSAAYLEEYAHEGRADYENRVRTWLMGRALAEDAALNQD